MNLIDLLDMVEQVKNQPTYDAVERGQRYGTMRGSDDYFDENLGTKFGPARGAVQGASGALRAELGLPYQPALWDMDLGAYRGAVNGRNATQPQIGGKGQNILNALIR